LVKVEVNLCAPPPLKLIVPEIKAFEETEPMVRLIPLLPSTISVEPELMVMLSLTLTVADELACRTTEELLLTTSARRSALLKEVMVLDAPLLIIRRSEEWALLRLGVQLDEVAAEAEPV
jgi:hypothetical protein